MIIAATAAARTLALKIRVLADCCSSTVERWRREARNRHALKFMSDRMLRDIGISRVEIATRVMKFNSADRDNRAERKCK